MHYLSGGNMLWLHLILTLNTCLIWYLSRFLHWRVSIFPNSYFLFPSLLLYLLIEFHVSNSPLFFQLFKLNMIHSYLFCSMDCNPLLSYLLCSSNCPIFNCWQFLQVSTWVLSTCPHHPFLKTSMLSGTIDVTGLSGTPLPQSRNQSFLQGALVLHLRT